MEFNHLSVLLDECIEGLAIKPEGIYVDGTLGGAGHSSEIVKKLTTGKLIGIDQDENAIKKATAVLEPYADKVMIVRNNFSQVKNVLWFLDIPKIDGILLDLGVSSHQLDEGERGFSYQHDARLDMRMNRESALSAYEVVNDYTEEDLHRIISEYGEENWSKRIAQFIVEARSEKPIETTFELVQIIKNAIPKKARQDGPHPAKRTFQAIRIEVNNELGIIKDTIKDAVEMLNPGGRICIITFHSLEDRIVKDTFKELALNCICPKEYPVCMCDKKQEVKIITRKPIISNKEELENNPRARSAKLRIAEKL